MINEPRSFIDYCIHVTIQIRIALVPKFLWSSHLVNRTNTKRLVKSSAKGEYVVVKNGSLFQKFSLLPGNNTAYVSIVA